MSHEPIQFGARGNEPNEASVYAGGAEALSARPRSLELKKEEALTIVWMDGRVSVYPIAYLRKRSPSAESIALREELASNPLAVLPSGKGGASSSALVAESAELVGNYAVRIRFSDGHDTGIYTWAYLYTIDPRRAADVGGV